MDSRPLCRFLLMGNCRYDAETCTSSHSLPEGVSITELRKTIPCPYYHGEKPNRKCRHQERCWFAHSSNDDIVPLCHPTNDSNRNELQCGICLQSVVGRGQRFALFTACDHTFCFSCAKSWHKNKQRRDAVLLKGESDLFIRKNNYKLLFRHSCPLCRKVSLNIVPSKYFLTGDRKQEYIQQYIKERGARVCCNGTSASCQFGDECYYLHCNQEDESPAQANTSPFLYGAIHPYSMIDDNNNTSSFLNINVEEEPLDTDPNTSSFLNINVDEEPSDPDSHLLNSIPELNILKSVMDALAFAKANEDSTDAESSLHSWLR